MSLTRKVVRHTAYIFVPLLLMVFLILLSSMLLITRGELSHTALVGFSVTGYLLSGLLLICNSVIYFTWVKGTIDMEKDGGASSSDSSATPRDDVSPTPAPDKVAYVDYHGQHDEQDTQTRRQREESRIHRERHGQAVGYLARE